MTLLADTQLSASRSAASRRRLVLEALRRRPSAAVALAFILVLVIVCCAASWLAPFDPQAQDLSAVLQGPSAHHWLGTDTLGRDVLSRLMYGGRRTFLSVAEGVCAVLALGIPAGLAAGYFAGWVNALFSRTAEIIMSIPAIIFVLVVLAAVPGNEDVAMLAFGALGAPAILRVARGATLKVREELYVTAARLSGLTHAQILVRHILPRIRGPLIVQASLFASYALLFESGIAFLGVTGNPSTPTWGAMVAEASTVLEQDGWLLIPSGVLIALSVLAFGLVGAGIGDTIARDAPRARGQRNLAGQPYVTRGSRAREATAIDGRPDCLLRVEDLCVRIAADDTAVVDGISFQIMPGETVGLMGESGCGKTVTALALLRLLPSALRTGPGTVELDGVNVTHIPERDFRKLRGRTIGFVSQEPLASLDPTFTIGSQLAEVVRHHDRASRAAARRRVLDLLHQVEISDAERVARSRVHELSGGMAQRAAIALALAGRPRLLIADEPTTALDVTVQAEVLSLLRRIQAKTRMAILLITHNWGVVADSCDRAIVMYAGQIVEEAGIEDLFEHPLHPYSLGLIESHPSSAHPGVPLPVMPGTVPSPGRWPAGCRFADRCTFTATQCSQHAIELAQPAAGHASRCVRIGDIFAGVST